MTPAFERGDLLFLSLTSAPFQVGDIVVYQIKGQQIPIVHRILELHRANNSAKLSLLTKGDYNPVDDRGLYKRGDLWISQDDIVGRVYAHLPYVGMITILLNDYPQAKVAVLLLLGLSAFLTKEE